MTSRIVGTVATGYLVIVGIASQNPYLIIIPICLWLIANWSKS